MSEKTYLVPPELAVISSIAAAMDEDDDIDRLNCLQSETKDGSVIFTATDGVAAIVVTRRQEQEIEITRFPDVQKVIPTGVPKLILRLSARRLRNMLAVVESLKINNDEAVIEWHGENKPCVIRAQEGSTTMVGVIMPKKKDE